MTRPIDAKPCDICGGHGYRYSESDGLWQCYRHWYGVTDEPQAGTSVGRGGAAIATPTGSTPVKAKGGALVTPAEGVPVAYSVVAWREIEASTGGRNSAAMLCRGEDIIGDFYSVAEADKACAALNATPAASAESIRAEVIEECARELDVRAAFWRKQREEAVAREASVGKRARHEYDYSDLCDARDSECQQRAIAIRALSARANKEV